MASVLVATSSIRGYVRAETDLALRNLDLCGNEVVNEHIHGYGVAQARNLMVLAAKAWCCDYLLMVDADVVPPSDALKRLISHGKDVCMGWYVRGSSDDGRTCAIKLGTRGYEDSYDAGFFMAADDLVEVKGNGMGCALVRTSVFDRLPHPWFKFTDYPDGSALGEDYWFCQQCSCAGIKLWVDPFVGCAHVHDRVLEAG